MTACSQPKMKGVGSCPYDNIDVAPWEGATHCVSLECDRHSRWGSVNTKSQSFPMVQLILLFTYGWMMFKIWYCFVQSHDIHLFCGWTCFEFIKFNLEAADFCCVLLLVDIVPEKEFESACWWTWEVNLIVLGKDFWKWSIGWSTWHVTRVLDGCCNVSSMLWLSDFHVLAFGSSTFMIGRPFECVLWLKCICDWCAL